MLHAFVTCLTCLLVLYVNFLFVTYLHVTQFTAQHIAYGLEFTQIHKMSIVLIWYYNIGRSCAGVMTAFLHFVQLEGLA